MVRELEAAVNARAADRQTRQLFRRRSLGTRIADRDAAVVGSLDRLGAQASILILDATELARVRSLLDELRAAFGRAVRARHQQFDNQHHRPDERRFYAAVAAANVGFMPTGVVPTPGAGGADSAWTASQAGNYYYFVTGINQNGESTGVLTAQVAVAAGQQVSLAIGASAGGTETGYVIYRSRQNGSSDLSDLREMDRVPKAGNSATTTYIDNNRMLPGSTSAFVLNLLPSDHAIAWRQFLPMMKIPMAAVNSPIIPWLQMICGYLRITKRAQHAAIVNIVPNSAKWKPFG